MKHSEHLQSKSWNQQNRHISRSTILSYVPILMALVVLPVMMIGLALGSFNQPNNQELLNIVVHARGDTGEEEIALVVDGEILATYSLTDRFAKYKYDLPYTISEDDIQVVFLNDGEASSGQTKGIKLDYIEVEGVRYTTKKNADYIVSDTTADPSCNNVSKDPTEVICSGVFEFTVANVESIVDEQILDNHRLLIRASGHTGEEIMLLNIKGQEVKRWKVANGFMGYTYSYEGSIQANDIQVEFINDGVTNRVNRNIDVDYIKLNDRIFQAEDPSVYSTGTWSQDNGCAPGFKQKARLSCNGYMQFDVGQVAVDETPPPPLSNEEEEILEEEIAQNTPIPEPHHDVIINDPSTYGGDPAPAPAPTPSNTGNLDLSDLSNKAVTSRYPNTPSSQLPIGSPLIDPFNKSLGFHRSEGQFRTRCQYSHLGYDDPIVYPGQDDRAHLHMFFGNTKTDHTTNNNTVLNSGGSSCQGGELNRTAYWVPALFDQQGRVRIPYDTVVYYKTAEPSKVEAMPAGLKMLTTTSTQTPKIGWTCSPNRSSQLNYNTGNTIPNCNSGDFVHGFVGFPSCWDGRLDSGNHKDHLAYPTKNGCPSSHSRVLPRITYNIYWEHEGNTSQWYLSSDRYNGARSPNGSTLHGDWYGGWNPTVMNIWTKYCTQGQRNCGVGPISATQVLASFSSNDRYQGPKFINDPRLQPGR